jgi:hypothetical protein
VPGELTSLLAAVICGVFVTVAEPVAIPLLRRRPSNCRTYGRHTPALPIRITTCWRRPLDDTWRGP